MDAIVERKVMRIAVISAQVFPLPPPGYSGLEFLAWQIAKGLGAKGHEVLVMAPDGSTCPNATVIPTGPPGWDEKNAYGKYWQQLLNVECIIDHSWMKNSYLLKQEGRLKAPILAVCHAPIDTMYRTLPAVDKPCFVCISDDQKAHFEGLFGRPARRVWNGVDAEYYKPIGLKRTDRFLFLARFSTIKGPHLAIEACKRAGVGLDLIGDTSITNEPEYLKQCLAMADGKQIRIVGSQTRGNCVWWYSQAHAFIHLCPQFREPFGLAPVEAQLCGLPCIAWNFGAMRETVKHGTTGLLVTTMDEAVEAVRAVAAGGQWTSDEARGDCREWARQFSVENMVNVYEALCQEAVKTGGW